METVAHVCQQNFSGVCTRAAADCEPARNVAEIGDRPTERAVFRLRGSEARKRARQLFGEREPGYGNCQGDPTLGEILFSIESESRRVGGIRSPRKEQ